MKLKLKEHFTRFGPRKFVLFVVITLVLLDLANGYYLKLYWMKKDVSLKIVHTVLAGKGMSASEFNSDTLLEVVKLADNAFYFFLFIVLLNNIFFYLFYYKRKLWAQGFVLFYTLTAGLMNGMFLFEGLVMGLGWWIFNFVTIFLYFYLYLGVKVLKEETTNPVRGKKVR